MNRLCAVIDKPLEVTVEAGPVPEPGSGEVRVDARLSAISSGTEMLVFEGRCPENLAVDDAIDSLSKGGFHYPIRYGYSSVGVVSAAGAGVDPAWVGRRVFAFHPHESHFTLPTESLIRIPDGIADDDAVFLAGMETAVNLVMDGRPVIGETVVVLGLGVIGLLTVSLLARFPLACLVGIDQLKSRREAAMEVGAHVVGTGSGSHGDGDRRGKPEYWKDGADLVVELTGSPVGPNLAVGWCGFSSRVVLGSWYGRDTTPLSLGGRFHRDRVRIFSSQVSTVDPAFSGRWTKDRRFAVAWQMIGAVRPSRWVSHRFSIRDAQKAYDQIARRPEDTLGVVFEYGEGEGGSHGD
ncbi:MAG: zinc-binding alcohol dehydrogenase [Desulfobacterales bacterium]|jgi:NADPH:quinone reductase-like Zn-dependent oxidoreductase